MVWSPGATTIWGSQTTRPDTGTNAGERRKGRRKEEGKGGKETAGGGGPASQSATAAVNTLAAAGIGVTHLVIFFLGV